MVHFAAGLGIFHPAACTSCSTRPAIMDERVQQRLDVLLPQLDSCQPLLIDELRDAF